MGHVQCPICSAFFMNVVGRSRQTNKPDDDVTAKTTCASCSFLRPAIVNDKVVFQ